MLNENLELKEAKLIWSGTTKEALEQGRITQEELDEWDRIDEEGERYSEGFIQGAKAERVRIKALIEEKRIETIGGFFVYVEDILEGLK